MDYQMLYVESRKSIKGRKGKKLFLCRVLNEDTRQTSSLPSVFWHSGNNQVCRVHLFCQVSFAKHSANYLALGKELISVSGGRSFHWAHSIRCTDAGGEKRKDCPHLAWWSHSSGIQHIGFSLIKCLHVYHI